MVTEDYQRLRNQWDMLAGNTYLLLTIGDWACLAWCEKSIDT